jgi:hypothetical protein
MLKKMSEFSRRGLKTKAICSTAEIYGRKTGKELYVFAEFRILQKNMTRDPTETSVVSG